jgi:hypothetical protein
MRASVSLAKEHLPIAVPLSSAHPLPTLIWAALIDSRPKASDFLFHALGMYHEKSSKALKTSLFNAKPH